MNAVVLFNTIKEHRAVIAPFQGVGVHHFLYSGDDNTVSSAKVFAHRENTFATFDPGVKTTGY
ncbi:MAG: hypothetical protein HC905_13820 [Bacteroidales bacterium]|nr:hypothetical protein [Bacteroidales bacterium]